MILVKDRVSHRVVRPLDAWATIQTGASTKRSIPVTITGEGGILLYMSEDETRDLPVGELQYDVVATVRRRTALAGGGWTSKTIPVATGILTVSDLNLVSSTGDSDYMEIRFKRGEDYRTSFSWTDANGALLTVVDAYMQAKNEHDHTVVDLRWFSSKPTESIVLALPATQRGYLAPYPEESLELHISDANSVPSGTYQFDLFVKGVEGDWVFLAGGALVVESSVSSRPT